MAWNREEKRRHHLRMMGKPPRIRPDELDRVRAHLVWLHDEHGMSWREISVEAGLYTNGTGLTKFMNGTTKGMLRSSYEPLMRVQPIPPGRNEHVGGAMVPVVGATRRIQALVALGFSMKTLDDIAGWGIYSSRRIALGINVNSSKPLAYVYASRDAEVRALYEKLSNAKPEDYGISRVSIGRALSYAKTRNWAPPGAWDDDTIDNPNAYPEFTGRCSTLAGAFIHLRAGTPICERCAKCVENKKNVVDVYKFHEVYQLGKSHAESAQLLGISRDLYNQYAQYLRTEERKVHSLSMVDKLAMTGYCDACRDQVQVYKSGSKLVCANAVRKYRKEKGL